MKYYISIICMILLFSCTENKKTIILTTNNADGITKKATIYTNGYEIGIVEEVNMNIQGLIYVFCSIDKKCNIAIGFKILYI